MRTEPYTPKHPIRFVTAASLFDGHDAAINIMRRILQASGAEVIHLGHNRSVQEVVDTAIQEDVQGIAVSSYQGGHMEYFKYMQDLLEERGAGHIRIFGGGGGVIVPEEIKELESYGIARIFSPEDGMKLGLQGMINHMLEQCDFDPEEARSGERGVRSAERGVRSADAGEGVTLTAGREIEAGKTRATAGDWGNGSVEKWKQVARTLTRAELRKGEPTAVPSGESAGEDLPEKDAQTAETGSGDGSPAEQSAVRTPHAALARVPVIGITGTGGAGKSTLTDELIRRFVTDFDDLSVAVLSVDPTKRRTGGALLGDRIRMNAIYGEFTNRVYMRSFATRQAHRSTAEALKDAIFVCKAAGYDAIIVETAGIGQSDTEITDLADVSIYVMTHDFGAPTQLEKIGMLDMADFVVLNKFEKRGSQDALRDIRKQVQRNRGLFDAKPEDMPVFPTMAAQFNDPGVTRLYLALLDHLNGKFGLERRSNLFRSEELPEEDPAKLAIIPPKRQRYLGEIVETARKYREKAEEQIACARKWGEAVGARKQIEEWSPEDRRHLEERLDAMARYWWNKLNGLSRNVLENWDMIVEQYGEDEFMYKVRDREIHTPLFRESLSGLRIPRVALPKTKDPGERLRYAVFENLPGFFPFTSGVFPFKRTSEDPTRMFAGEGSPERTNRRFHLVSLGLPAKRLSTAFDSVTLYGFDPDERPDIYGKVGNAGVSICTLDDMKKLYSGFNLCDPATSVSMTINGPAPMILAMFMNTAIDQQVEFFLKKNGRWDNAEKVIAERLGDDRPKYVPYNLPEGTLPEGHDGSGLGLLGTSGSELVEWGVLKQEEYDEIQAKALNVVRGTVQADILKEDQAQNTCIFSTEFALKMMGDIQQYFIEQNVRNYYSVSISGYHIAEAGANPISQLAFTLANGFTYVEYYLSRGMDVNKFAPNLSFFFSNGLDPEYSVIGRVARRIWSVAMRDLYGGNERSQKLKYHIQTSGRSLHAKEIQFNDIRTTLQALIAVYDNCNSLHTNAFDEAITTPTEESVRRAMAIQLIINREFGMAMNENPLQGSYIVEELTDLVEEAVLLEFDRINERGGVLGAMESMYQRGKIQEESMFYEHKKHTGEMPIIGVNTFTVADSEDDLPESPVELMRSTEDEKQRQLRNVRAFNARSGKRGREALMRLQEVARNRGNIFAELMETVKTCSLGEITHALFDVGGQYRRSM